MKVVGVVAAEITAVLEGVTGGGSEGLEAAISVNSVEKCSCDASPLACAFPLQLSLTVIQRAKFAIHLK